jgi:hypothetical protein
MTISLRNEKVQRALAEVQAIIKTAYPEAEFQIACGEDPVGIYIDAYTDAVDGFCVLDLVSDRLVDLNVDEGLPIHVIPLPKAVR